MRQLLIALALLAALAAGTTTAEANGWQRKADAAAARHTFSAARWQQQAHAALTRHQARIPTMPVGDGTNYCYWGSTAYPIGYYANPSHSTATTYTPAVGVYPYSGAYTAANKVWYYCGLNGANGATQWFEWASWAMLDDPGYGAWYPGNRSTYYWQSAGYCLYPYLRYDGDYVTFGPGC